MSSQKLLETYLRRWLAADLLTIQQAEKILEFEQAKAGIQESRLLRGLAMLAAFSIGLGLISVIAANWALIAPSIKLISYFLLTAGLSFSLTRLHRLPFFVAEALPILYLLLILAGIGLIAQIYHLPSDSWRGLALWSALGLAPTVLLSREKMSTLWMASYLMAWLAWIGHQPLGIAGRLDIFVLHWAVLGLGCFASKALRLPETLRPWVIIFSLGLVFVFYPYALAFGFGANELRSALMSLLVMAVAWCWVPWLWRSLSTSQRILVLLGLVAFSLRAGLIYVFGQDMAKHWSNLAETSAVLVQGTAMAILALHHGQNRWFHLLFLLMLVRVAGLFVGLFGSLLQSGLGLILMGIVILLILKGWQKYRNTIEARLREWGR